MSAYSDGLYVLTLWAGAGDVSAAQVRANYEKNFGKAAVESLGAKSKGVNFGVLQDAFRDAIDEGADRLNPNLAEVNTPLLNTAGYSSVFTAASGAISDTIDKAEEIGGIGLNILKYVAIIAIVGAAAYVLFQAGALRKLNAK